MPLTRSPRPALLAALAALTICAPAQAMERERRVVCSAALQNLSAFLHNFETARAAASIDLDRVLTIAVLFLDYDRRRGEALREYSPSDYNLQVWRAANEQRYAMVGAEDVAPSAEDVVRLNDQALECEAELRRDPFFAESGLG